MARARRRSVDARVAAVAGAGYLGLGALAGLDPTRLERFLFRAANGTSGPVPATSRRTATARAS